MKALTARLSTVFDKWGILWIMSRMEPGITDELVLNLANQAECVLLTADKDFGELVYRQPRLMPVIILVRLAGLSPDQKANLVALVIRERAQEFLHAFTVITPKSIRIRQSR
jgi:predicted nuclease of predicted toxin-antitoxin system